MPNEWKLVSKDIEESEENYLKRVCRANPAIASMFVFFDRDLHLGIGVFRELRKGNAKNFINALPRMVLHKDENERLRNTSSRGRVRRPSSRLDFNN